MSRVVLLPGVVTGSGRAVDCEVMAWKTADHEDQAFSQFKIVAAPRHLPDGSYTVEFGGVSLPTRKESGWWTMESLAW